MPAQTVHPNLPQPDRPEVSIWRYMDFAKYVSMLDVKGLYFPRLDQLGDPFEGSLSRDEFQHLKEVAADGEARRAIPDDWQGKYFDKYLLGVWRRARRLNYVSCWHMNEVESEAMWRLYSPSGFGIAVRSQYSRLVDALPANIHNGCYMSTVRYVDHHTDRLPRGNGFTYITHKRSAFAHERECRAIVWWKDPGPDREEELDERPLGMVVPIDLNSLVDEVVTSPTSPAWFSQTVQSVSEAFSFAFPVRRSDLLLPAYV